MTISGFGFEKIVLVLSCVMAVAMIVCGSHLLLLMEET
jgi:hypothetical protein